MTRSEKLSTALEVLDYKLNKKFSSLVELMQNKIDNDKKLNELITYKNNYSEMNMNKKNQTISNFQIHHKIMEKLQLAIDAQQNIVIDLEKRVNQQIQSLKDDRAQTKALESLVNRYRQQENRLKNQNEQKELDSQILATLRNGMD